MKQVKVINLIFTIKEVNMIDNNADVLGLVDHIEQVIYIRQDLSKERKKIVLIHEMLHSILQQLGFSELHDNENLIESLSTSIYQTFETNDLF